MFTDYFLKFPDEATATSVLYRTAPVIEQPVPLQPVDGEPVEPPTEPAPIPNFRNIDTIGAIYRTVEGEEPVAAEGWHVNVRVLPDEDSSALDQYRINPDPSSPVRVWA